VDAAEQDLVGRAVAGEPLALDRLLLAHYGSLHARVDKRLPQRLRTTVAPEDVIQETFAEAFRTIGGFKADGPDAFYRWLVTIADHRLVDAVRAHRAAKRGGDRAPAVQAGHSSIAAMVDLVAMSERTPSVSAGGHEAAAAVQVALAGLRPEYREALTLRYMQGLPVAEVAARMGRTESAVHKVCSRALQALKESMGEASRYLSRA
jgi:RNA polymerase sigma-70 factor (ECF subfamily)